MVSNLLTVAHFWLAIRSQSLIFGEWSDRSSHSSLKQREWANCWFFKTYKKRTKKWFYSNIFEWITRSMWVKEWFTQKKWAIRSGCSFVMSNLSNLLTVAHFWWVTWVNCSWLLIFSEQPVRFTHSCSFVMSDLSKFLTVAL